MAQIEIEHLTKRYHGGEAANAAVADLSLAIEAHSPADVTASAG